MLLLQYIDELQDNKCASISQKNGGCPPLQADYLRRKTDQAGLSIDVPRYKKCSTITEKNGCCPPLEIGVLPPRTDKTTLSIDIPEDKKCSTTMDKHGDCPLLEMSDPPGETHQTGFDFIVKHPAAALLWALRRDGVETLINDFLDTIFNLGVDPINLQDEELREHSPLVYAEHDPIREDQIVKEVKVRLELRPDAGGGFARTANLRLCEKIHSVKAREDRTCSYYLSTVDIFGVEPVRNTEFSVCWDAAFFSQIISDGQRVLGSLTARAASLASNLVGLCEWVTSNLLLLTRILGQSYARTGSWNLRDVLFTCLNPAVLLSLLEAAGSLFIRLAEWRHALQPPSTQAETNWRNDVRQASQRLENVTTTITALAEAAELAETPNEQLMERAKELYFTSHELLVACKQAISCNKAIWDRFQTRYLRGAAGIGCGTPGIVYATQKGVQNGIRSLVLTETWAGAFGAAGFALSVLSVGLGVADLCKARKYGNICESLDECLVTTVLIMFSCETITRRLLIPQNEPAAGGHEAALQRERWWRKFMDEAIRITGEDPVTMAFTFHRHYSVYLRAQNSALRRVRARLDTLVGES